MSILERGPGVGKCPSHPRRSVGSRSLGKARGSAWTTDADEKARRSLQNAHTYFLHRSQLYMLSPGQ